MGWHMPSCQWFQLGGYTKFMGSVGVILLLLSAAIACEGPGATPAPTATGVSVSALTAEPTELATATLGATIGPTITPSSPAMPTPTPGPTTPLVRPHLTLVAPSEALQTDWALELLMSWEPANVGGLSNLLLGVSRECATAHHCVGTHPPSLPGVNFIQVYICHPADIQQMNCDGLLPDALLSKSLRSPDEATNWVVEVYYPGPLNIRFGWDNAKLPENVEVRMVVEGDENGNVESNIDMGIPPGFRFHTLILDGEHNQKAFRVCSQVRGSRLCPE